MGERTALKLHENSTADGICAGAKGACPGALFEELILSGPRPNSPHEGEGEEVQNSAPTPPPLTGKQ